MKTDITRNRPTNLIIAVVAICWCGGVFSDCGGLGLKSSVFAQGLDDLFAEPSGGPLGGQRDNAVRDGQSESGQFTDPASRTRSAETRPAYPPARPGERSAGQRNDSAVLDVVRSPSDIRLYNSNGSGEDSTRSMAMRLRQARALEENRQNIARLEAARWAGVSALRPNWNPSPTTASLYSYRRVIYVPVYVPAR